MRIFIILGCLLMTLSAVADEPEQTLDKYFLVLTTQNFDSIGSIMDSQDMAAMKELMVKAIGTQMRAGRYRLQERIFGKKVTLEKVKETSAEFYLNQLAGQILSAATSQNFVVDKLTTLGRVDESDSMIHYVVRASMSQGGNSSTNVRIYTVVKNGDVWKMKFPDVIKQMLVGIEASMQRR